MGYMRGAHRLALIVALAWLALAGMVRLVVAESPSVARREPPRAPMVAGELLVRLRSDFPACAHCLLAKGAGLKSVTGTYILDQVRLKHRITAMEPVFGGVHATERRKAAQLRYGRSATGGGAGALHSQLSTVDLSQIYLVRVDPKTDLLALAAEFRRDPNVVSAVPNYLYSVRSTVDSRRSTATSSFPRPLGEGQACPEPCGRGEGDATDASPPQLPNDPFLNSSGSWGQDFPDLWGLFQIHAPEAWELSRGEGMIVAVVDTGIDITHPDLAANVWHNTEEIPGNGIDDDRNGFVDDVDGWDFTRPCTMYTRGVCTKLKERGPDVRDELGHGTHVAGTIAAVGDNGIGLIGVAPRATVMAVKALDQSGTGSNCDLAEAIVYAAENGAKVINTSWEGPPSDTIRMAIDYVTQIFDAVVVASAGNDAAPLEQGYYPANLPKVIAVGATTHTDAAAAFSNVGGPLDLVAPGGGDADPAGVTSPDRSILSLLAKDSDFGRVCTEVCHDHPDDLGETCETVCEVAPEVIADDYVRAAGTSFAAPHVSGVAALVRSRHPEFSRAQTQQVLLNTADDLGSVGWDRTFGYGRVNAARAVEVDDVPVAQINAPDNNGKLWERDFPFTVKGNALSPKNTLRTWRLTVRREGYPLRREIAQGSEPVVGGVLGTVPLGSRYRLYPGRRYTLELEVEDAAGGIATDSRTFLIPKPLFASIPIPDRYFEGGQDLMLSADGTRVILNRFGHDVQSSLSEWLYDVVRRELRPLPVGGFLAPDGRVLAGYGITPGHPYGSGLLYNIDSDTYLVLPYSVLPGPTDEHGDHIAFTSSDDPLGESPGRSWQAFMYDVRKGLLRQITHAPKGDNPANREVDELQLSADGRRLVFTSFSDLDPSASTGGIPQIFLYDDATGAIRQLTDRSGPPTGSNRPSLSADGLKVAYQHDHPGGYDGIDLQDLARGTVEHVLDNSLGAPNIPVLSGDGTKLAFNAFGDLDPRVGNEDQNFEVFVLDLATREITQVTDTINQPLGEDAVAVSSSGDVILNAGESELNGLQLKPPLLRAVRRQKRGHAPQLDVPPQVTVPEGQTTEIQLRAKGADGDPITFYAQRVPMEGLLVSLLRFANSELVDHGDGTAVLSLTPQHDDAGQYGLRIAAFDETGAVDIRDIALTIADTQPEGDANCDGSLGEDDIAAMIAALFSGQARTHCISTDTNDDGQVGAADLVALLTKLAAQR